MIVLMEAKEKKKQEEIEAKEARKNEREEKKKHEEEAKKKAKEREQRAATEQEEAMKKAKEKEHKAAQRRKERQNCINKGMVEDLLGHTTKKMCPEHVKVMSRQPYPMLKQLTSRMNVQCAWGGMKMTLLRGCFKNSGYNVKAVVYGCTQTASLWMETIMCVFCAMQCSSDIPFVTGKTLLLYYL